jgi:hypothetical protein
MQKQRHLKSTFFLFLFSFIFQLSYGQNPCASNPCLNGGLCIQLLDSYDCGCTEYWFGSTCGFLLPMTLDSPNTPLVYKNDVDVALDNNISVAGFSGGLYDLPASGPSDMTISFTITGGTLTLGTTDITFGGDGNGSSSFTATGQAEALVYDSETPPNVVEVIDGALNIALDEATFTPTPNLFGENAGNITFTAVYGPGSSESPASTTFDILDSTLSLENQNFERHIKIYPIPVKDIINIANNTQDIITKIEIVDVLGGLISSTKLSAFNSNLEIDVSSFNSGIYFMRISKENYTLIRKIILK